MSAGDVTEITCGGCNAGHDWYCVKCWNGIVRELHDVEVQRDALRAEVEAARAALGAAWCGGTLAEGIARKCRWLESLIGDAEKSQ